MTSSRARGPGGRRPDLTTGPITRTLLLFSLPALGSNVLQSINASVNAAWVGHFLGETGLAATANANLVIFMMFAVTFGFGMAATVVIGQSMGRRDIPMMRQAVGTGLGLFAVLGVATAVLGWFLAPDLLLLLGTPSDTLPQALVYLRIMFVGLPPALLTVFLSMALRGTGDALTPLFLMLPGAAIDVLLNPVLILGLGPAPRLGILGSGLATLVANFVSFALMLIVIYARDLSVRLRGAELRYLIPRRHLVVMLVRTGIPMGLQMIVMSGSALVMLGLVNAEGTVTVAAYGAVNQLWTYIQMPAIAIGMAVSTMAAQNIGADRWDRVHQITRSGIVINLCLTGVLVALTDLLDRQILTLFLPSDAAAINIAARIATVASWSFILMGATLIVSSVMRANGATLVPLAILAIAYIPGRLGPAYALKALIGTTALWWSFPISTVLSLIMTTAFYRHGSWRRRPLLATEEEAQELVQSEADLAGRMLPNG